MIPGAIKMLSFLTKGTLRQTKHLSPFKRATKISKKEKKLYKSSKANVVGGKELRPWASGLIGQKGLLRKAGLSATKRRQALYGYERGYKHLAKHKKLYGAGAGGAVIWDMMDDD